jgi:aconitate hydratase
MGVLPLPFLPGEDAAGHHLTGEGVISIAGIAASVTPEKRLTVRAGDRSFHVIARIDTSQEVEYVAHGGILQYVLRQRAAQRKPA